ncbi:hypothetical protein HF846_15870 [Clostridium cadaveris]|nr:hypothetical protein [Clostridium cadaveris]NME66065.1 hypothetical protein [Clostridium cadaveris]
MGMSKEEFMKRYKADMEKKAKDKECDYRYYIINLHMKKRKERRYK